MSRQEEDFKSRAKYFIAKAARESGPYREVLLGVAEGFATLATHQAELDNWPRLYPGPSRQVPHQVPREELRQAPHAESREPPRPESRQMAAQAPAPLPRATPAASPKR